MLDKLKSKLMVAREKAEAQAAALLPEDWKVPDEVSAERYNICKNCENLYHATNQCRLCGCFMGVKVSLARANCPIHKWEKYGRYKDLQDS
jgi:hypothetical protein